MCEAFHRKCPFPADAGEDSAGIPAPVAPPTLMPTLTTADPSDVTDLTMIYLVLDAGGAIQWTNEAALRLLRQAGATHITGATLTNLVHHDDRHSLEVALGNARTGKGGVEAVVRPAAMGGLEEERYMDLVLSRSESAAGRPNESGPAIVVQGWDVSALVLHIHELEIHAYSDPLTGLANRITFIDRLRHEIARSVRTGMDLAVLFADIDGFKAVNDTYGHEAGDQVLVRVSRRLAESLRPADTLARIGGDEFAVICPDLLGPEQAMTVADRLRVNAAEPLTVRDQQLSVTLSIGVAFASDDDYDDPAAALLRRADNAMYDLKRRRPGGIPPETPLLHGGDDGGRHNGDRRRGADAAAITWPDRPTEF
jgi:diguanylate cyclase (GGDEF)-like protein